MTERLIVCVRVRVSVSVRVRVHVHVRVRVRVMIAGGIGDFLYQDIYQFFKSTLVQ